MSDQLKVYLTRQRKRKLDEENEQQAKRQKAEAAVVEPDSNQIKLTDVIDDCLEAIFMHLSFEDLLNIADTNKELKQAADLAFTRKFGKKYFSIRIEWIDSDQDEEDRINFDGKWIIIKYLKTALQTLRSFGHLIPKLKIASDGWLDKIGHYANQYCFKSLEAIVFHNNNDIFKYFEKPFFNVKIVILFNCTIKKNLSRWFPKMSYLMFDDVKANPECIEMHFPRLRRLEIIGGIPTPQIANTLGLLRLNPRLRSLKLAHTADTAQLVRWTSENLNLWKNLEIQCDRENLLAFNGDVIAFESLRCLKIDYSSFRESTNAPVPISCDRLEEFWYGGNLHSQVDDNIINFLKKHPSIIKLNMAYVCGHAIEVDLEKAISIAEALPLLQKVNFNDQMRLSIESVIPFTGNASLKTLYFTIKPSEFDELKTRLDNQWQVTLDGDNRVELKRKD